MGIDITCFFCFETFEIMIDLIDGPNREIWDCEVCCNPNLVSYKIIKQKVLVFDISSGNE
ncbi:MAG: hypothetical protein CMG60_07350 [Candidatus Marinimicrobia bacterium]|nr:hypothetical protein [Candidatus Neomarinimicrobiota bacterium]